MYDLVPPHVLVLLVFGPTVILLGIMALASLYFWARRTFFGVPESVTNTTLPDLLEMAERQDR